jgi:hypothetical protein
VSAPTLLRHEVVGVDLGLAVRHLSKPPKEEDHNLYRNLDLPPATQHDHAPLLKLQKPSRPPATSYASCTTPRPVTLPTLTARQSQHREQHQQPERAAGPAKRSAQHSRVRFLR